MYGGIDGKKIKGEKTARQGRKHDLRIPYCKRREDAERPVAVNQPTFARISCDADRYNQYWKNEAGDL
jgi:hypothetical protein